MTLPTCIAECKGEPIATTNKEVLKWYWINTTGSCGAVAVPKKGTKIAHSMSQLLAWMKGKEFDDVIYYLEEQGTFINYMRVR